MRPASFASLVTAAALAGGVAAAAGPAPAGASGRPGRIERVVHPTPTRVRIEGGRFTMGVPPDDVDVLVDECQQVTNLSSMRQLPDSDLCGRWGDVLQRRIHRDVYIDAFSIDVSEVTVGEYRQCVATGPCPVTPLLIGDVRHMAADLPQVNVTRDEAEGFCAWRGGRLPTEAEWEKAARGEDLRTWPGGDQMQTDDFNHGRPRAPVLRQLDEVSSEVRLRGDTDPGDGWPYAAPPGRMRWSDGPYGTHDQAGNVAEWVLDDWSEEGFDGLPTANPLRRQQGPASAMTRGGSWRDPPFAGRVDVPSYESALAMLPGAIIDLEPGTRAVHIGFRCVYGGAAIDP